MKKTVLAAVLVTALGISSASGELILSINTVDKTFAFSGSVSGTASYFSRTLDRIYWEHSSGATTETWDDAIRLDTVLLLSQGTPSSSLYSLKSYTSGGNAWMSVNLMVEGLSNDPVSVTGSGTYMSYADWSEQSISMLEGMVGESLHSGIGIDEAFSNISIEAVPEPATAGLLGISVGAIWLIRRLKKAANYYRT